ncbi:hypothetical protein NDI37_20565 [Funiculus sociatus GB2-A5]|uniref:Uncharacterized protein n=2 Tax=Cyanobacteriota TaxID=1117 RepID=A0ABV0JTR2_9CYAN|nr:hypothetical protein [Trichocoleus sp. FACHB-6]
MIRHWRTPAMILVGDGDRICHLFLGFPVKSAIAHQIYLVNSNIAPALFFRRGLKSTAYS